MSDEFEIIVLDADVPDCGCDEDLLVVELPGEKGNTGDQGPKGDKGDKGDQGDPGISWQWDYYDAVNEAVIIKASLANSIEPIIFFNGQPMDIELLLIDHVPGQNKLDFSAYAVDNGNLTGKIRWKYQS